MNQAASEFEILKVAREYMGKNAWPTVLTAVAAFAVYLCVFVAALLGHLPLWAGFLLLSYLVYVIYTPLHESVHHNIFGPDSKLSWLNTLIGYAAASILGVSYAAHRAAHMAHHRATNVQGKDPDLAYGDDSLTALVLGGPKIIVSEYRTYFENVFPSAPFAAKAGVLAEIAVAIGWRAALIAAGFPLEVLVLAVLANWAGLSLLGMLFAWIVHRPFDQTARYRNTATILLPKWIHQPATVLWLWQNYHSIHHLFPRVPFYDYARVFDQIEQGMIERGAPIVAPGRRGHQALFTRPSETSFRR